MTTEPKSMKLTERSPVQVGDSIAGKYCVEQLIAAGGMGIIVGARHTTLGQGVAIKLLLPDSSHDQRAERFLREARAAAAIESRHVCRVFDCGTHDGGIPYMVMEHLSGHDLSQELKARGPLPVSEAVDLVLQALEGIAEAHALGIVHRDLKPSNLFLSQKPGRPREVKVLDFGISKLTPAFEASAEDDLTHTEMMLGSPRYMSPEQVQNARSVDARSDVWSLGVILYQLLDGRSPFAGTTMGETIGKVLTHDAPPIAARRSDVPAGLAQVLDRCLQRDRERRYRNVAELALALAPFGSGASQSSIDRATALLVGGQLAAAPAARAEDDNHTTIALGPSEEPEPSVGTVGPVTQGKRSRPPRPKRGVALWVGLALGVALTGGGLVAWRALANEPAELVPAMANAAPAPAPAPTPSASAEPEADAAAAVAEKPAPKPEPRPPVIRRPPAKKTADDILSESY